MSLFLYNKKPISPLTFIRGGIEWIYMKYNIKKSLFIALFCFSIASPTYAATTQELYVSALQQVIVLLTQQVNLLLQQLNALQTNPPAQPVPVTTITPTSVPLPTFGSVSTSTQTPVQTPLPTEKITIESGGIGTYWQNSETKEIFYGYDLWAFYSGTSGDMMVSTGALSNVGEFKQDTTMPMQIITSIDRKGLGRFVKIMVNKNGSFPITFSVGNASSTYVVNADFCEFKPAGACGY